MSSDPVSRVFLLRSGSDPDPYVEAFAAAGLAAECVPVLSFSFPRQGALRERMERPKDYGGLICTSPRAVRALRDVLSKAAVEAGTWTKKAVYAVGPRTAGALRVLGFEPVGEESGGAGALSSVIASSKTLLFLCGNRRRDTLPDALTDARIPFEELVVYETHTRSDLALPAGAPGDWLAFFSPSGIEAIERAPRVDPRIYRRAAIGPTTAAALDDHGWPPEATAATPTPASLVEAVRHAMDGSRGEGKGGS